MGENSRDPENHTNPVTFGDLRSSLQNQRWIEVYEISKKLRSYDEIRWKGEILPYIRKSERTARVKHMGPNRARRIEAFTSWARQQLEADSRNKNTFQMLCEGAFLDMSINSYGTVFYMISHIAGAVLFIRGKEGSLFEFENNRWPKALHIDWRDALWSVLEDFED